MIILAEFDLLESFDVWFLIKPSSDDLLWVFSSSYYHARFSICSRHICWSVRSPKMVCSTPFLSNVYLYRMCSELESNIKSMVRADKHFCIKFHKEAFVKKQEQRSDLESRCRVRCQCLYRSLFIIFDV